MSRAMATRMVRELRRPAKSCVSRLALGLRLGPPLSRAVRGSSVTLRVPPLCVLLERSAMKQRLSALLQQLSPLAYTVLRIVSGALFACHGAQKLFGVLGGKQAPL